MILGRNLESPPVKTGKRGVQGTKLSSQDVLLILRCAEGIRGSMNRRARLLAPEFSVSVEYVREILQGQAWRHVTVPFIEKSKPLIAMTTERWIRVRE